MVRVRRGGVTQAIWLVAALCAALLVQAEPLSDAPPAKPSAAEGAVANQQAPNVVVMGLFANSAVVRIDGHERILRTGKTSPEGVTLLSSNTKQAEIDNNGKRQTLAFNRGVGTRFSEPPVTEVRIASQLNGHYITQGRINNKPVEFLVDTGASSIAMNSTTAKQLGITFNASNAISVQTAQGEAKAYQVLLDSAAVGGVVVHSPEAFILEGDYPQFILLGNTFLSRVDLKVEKGVMVLQTKY